MDTDATARSLRYSDLKSIERTEELVSQLELVPPGPAQNIAICELEALMQKPDCREAARASLPTASLARFIAAQKASGRLSDADSASIMAASVLCQLAADSSKSVAQLPDHGASAHLVDAVRSGSSSCQLQALAVIERLSTVSVLNSKLAQEGAAPVLQQLLMNSDPALVEASVRALSSVACSTKDMTVCGIVPERLLALASKADQVAQDSIIGVVEILSQSRINRRKFSDLGAVPRLLQIVRVASEPAKVSAVRALTVLLCDEQAVIEAVEIGGYKVLLDLLTNKSPALVAHAGSAISTLLANAPQSWPGEMQRTLPVLIGQLSSACSTTQEVCSQILLQLSTRKEDKFKLVHAGVLPELFRLVQKGSVDCQELVIATLRNLASNAESRVEIGTLGGVEVLIQAIADERPTPRAKENACAALVNLAMNSEVNKRRIVDGGGLQVLLQMLAAVEAGGGQEQAIAALRNIASLGDNKEVIANAGTIQLCLSLIETSGTELAKEHAAATLANLASGCIPNKQRIADEGGIPVLVGLVTFPLAYQRCGCDFRR
jgi:hypothetical protein